MDAMEVDAYESIVDALPAEIWHQIFRNLSVSDLPSIIRSCKYINNSITIKIKRDLIAKLKSTDVYGVKYKAVKRKFSEHFLKLAVQYNDASYMDEFLTEEIWPWNVVSLLFVPEQKRYNYTKPKEPPFRMKFFEEMLTNNATNVLEWIMTQFDNIEPEALGFSVKKNGSFQLFLLCFLKSLLATEKTIRKLKIYSQAMKIIEKYNDVVIRLVILAREGFSVVPDLSNVDKNTTDSYVCFDYNSYELLDKDPLKYLQFLIYIHVTHDQYNFNFDTATADIFENNTNEELFALPMLNLPLALMLTPLELAYYVNDHLMVDEIQKISPIDKKRPYIAWVIAHGPAAENRFLNSLSKLADLNAKFTPGIQALLEDIYKKPIETALGMALLRYAKPARMCTIEWLLSNGAKFSENESSFILKQTSLNLKKVLFASETPKYSILKNIPTKEVDLKIRNLTFKQCPKKGSFRDRSDLVIRPNSTFSKFKKGEYKGKWELTDNLLTCKSEKFEVKFWSGGSNGAFTETISDDKTEFKFKIVLTCYDDPVLIDADSKTKTPTFNNLLKLHWCEMHG